MSTKSSPKPRTRKRPPKEEKNNDSLVAPVHKPIKQENNQIETLQISNGDVHDDSSESNRTYTIVEDKNDNIQTISRDISVDSELHINSKIERGIIGFMETEIIKEKSKYSHFTDSRPQSLSFYEEEKAPEELSGQLEQLSPEEKRVLKRRKDDRKIDIELDASTYKEIQNVLNREKEDALLAGIIKSQKSKSRKKKQFDSEESLAGIGDSREQMIPSGKRKTKKSKSKSKESSPLPGSSHKKKHRKRDEYEPKNDITVALDELQDDVFERDSNEFTYQQEPQIKIPVKSNTVYVQKRNGFEATPRDKLFTKTENNKDESESYSKRFSEMSLIEIAARIQKFWLPFTVLCHGLLAGLALAHTILIHGHVMNEEFLKQYYSYSEPYTCIFYILCVICTVSVFDRFDIKRCSVTHLTECLKNRKSVVTVPMYVAALLIHLSNSGNDELITMYRPIENFITNFTLSENSTEIINVQGNFDYLSQWNALSLWKSILVILGWIIIALSPNKDMFYAYLSDIPSKAQTAIP